jgi:uncharacterized membrane protein YheB (UPF0754 family)
MIFYILKGVYVMHALLIILFMMVVGAVIGGFILIAMTLVNPPITAPTTIINKMINKACMTLVGAVIGGLTNVIAIKMLFHPFNPYYIFKIRVPLYRLSYF